MDFEFKKLSDVNVVETVNSGSHVLMEDGGEIVKIKTSKVSASGLPPFPEFKTIYERVFAQDEWFSDPPTIGHNLTDTISLKDGETYQITIGGETFTAIASKTIYAEKNATYIGNLSLGSSSFEDTGEPYVLGILDEPYNGITGLFFINKEEWLAAETLMVELKTKVEVPSNLMLVTDADGNTSWEERTHYSYKRQEHVNILPEMTIPGELLEDTGGYITTSFILDIGKNYKVTYGGEEYDCIAIEIIDDGITGVILGNVGIIDETLGEDNGMPFVIISSQGADISGGGDVIIYGMIYFLDGETSKSFSITYDGLVEHIKTIDEKYLPSGKMPSGDVEIIFTETTIDNSTSYSCNLSYDELCNMDVDEIARNAVFIDAGGNRHSVQSVRKKRHWMDKNYFIFQIDIDMFIDTEIDAGSKGMLVLEYQYLPGYGQGALYPYEYITLRAYGDYQDAYHNIPIISNSNFVKYFSIGDGLEADGSDDANRKISVVLKSPSGKRFNLSVDDNGTLSTVEITA